MEESYLLLFGGPMKQGLILHNEAHKSNTCCQL